MSTGRTGSLIRQIRAMTALGVVGAIASILLAGCLNQVGPKKSTNKASPIYTIFSGENPPAVIVQKAVRSQVSPQSSVDLIGEAAFTTTSENPRSGELGSFCAGDSNGPGCNCLIRATIVIPCSTGGNPENCSSRQETVEIRYPPAYYEGDLVRCQLPNLNTSVLDLSLEKTTLRTSRSNVLSFTLTPDLTFDDPLFYSPVRRYACRWSPFISHMMDPSVIDPIQSESNDTTLTLLYYSTNMGAAMAKFADSDPAGQQYFQCPPHVDPAKLSDRLELNGSTLGSESLDFLLAKSASGPFRTPILISQAPGISASEPLGYAASPNASDGNGCPRSSDVKIPDKMVWRKLWLYRGVQDKRKYYSSSKLRNFSIGCNPGRLKNDYHVIQNVNATGANGQDYTIDYLPANLFHAFSDCGRAGFYRSKSQTSSSIVLDQGYSCSSGGSLQFSEGLAATSNREDTRILLNNKGGHRCIAINDSGTSWQDQCPISESSCRGGGNQPEGLDLCEAKGSRDDLKTDFSSDVSLPEIISPVEYVFMTTDPSVDAPVSGLTRPQGTSDAIFLRVDKLNQAEFPLCVLSKAGGT